MVDDADKLTKSLKVWCDLRRKEHADMRLGPEYGLVIPRHGDVDID